MTKKMKVGNCSKLSKVYIPLLVMGYVLYAAFMNSCFSFKYIHVFLSSYRSAYAYFFNILFLECDSEYLGSICLQKDIAYKYLS